MTDKMAYYLGFLATDGWVNNKTLGFALKRSDRKSVEYIASITSYLTKQDIEIKDYDAKCNGKIYPASRFTITNRELTDALNKYGIVQSKSYI